MSLYYSLLHSLAIIVGLILITLLLRKKSVVSVDDRPLFGRLVTDFALPAMIFSGLARQTPAEGEIKAVAIMMISLFAAMLLAWIVGRALQLKPAQMGAFVLVAAFGSSSTLGYALISQTFPGDPTALAEAVVISELGVGIPIFIVGVAVAIHYGRKNSSSPMSGLKTFLTSPIFISLILGLAFALLRPPLEGPLASMIFGILDLIGNSLVIFVALAIGLMLRPIPFRDLGILILAVAAIKLITKPLIALSLSQIELLPPLETEILLIEAAMPSGTVAAVLADRYGCDGATASALVIATYVLCMLTIPLIMLLS